jgi:hypothetical protein
MYLSRLSFSTRPSHTEDVAQRLKHLADLVASSGMRRPRVLRVSMASPGAPDLVFEQEFEHLADLEQGLQQVAALPEFKQWSQETSELLLHSPKREILTFE